MSTRFLDDEARRAFKHAIEAIEGASGMEVVVAVRRRSARYVHANFVVGAIVAFASLAAMLFSDYEFGLTAILFDPFVVGAAAGLLVELLPAVKRILTPPVVRQARVAQAARATFVDRGVHNTMDRSGVLLYVSWLEQCAVLVADSGLAQKLAPRDLADADEQLTAAVPRGGATVARALEAFGLRHAGAMPRRLDDINELPDDIDSDEGAT